MTRHWATVQSDRDLKSIQFRLETLDVAAAQSLE
jgi:hypothetical protein